MSDPDEVVRITKEELDRLKFENAKLREALQHIADHDEGLDSYFVNVAREALNDLRKGGE